MFWMNIKENGFPIRTLIWRPENNPYLNFAIMQIKVMHVTVEFGKNWVTNDLIIVAISADCCHFNNH